MPKQETHKDLSNKRKREEGSKVYDINKSNFVEYMDAIEEDCLSETKLSSKSSNGISETTKTIRKEEDQVMKKRSEEENRVIAEYQQLFNKALKIEVSGLKIKQVVDVDMNTILDWKSRENFKTCKNKFLF
jgi:hypothetical protein